MALSNQQRIGHGLDLLKVGLMPFIEREMKSRFGDRWSAEVQDVLADTRLTAAKGNPLEDSAALLVLMDRKWTEVFRATLGKAERSLVNELIDFRNRWAHQQPFSSDDTDRALDSMSRLLTAVSAPEADEVNKMKAELRRTVYEQHVRNVKHKSGGSLIDVAAAGGLKPWREIATPHADVQSGRYQQAEFAADLWQVHIGEGSDEYKNPTEFYRRTYLTESLKQLLVGGVQRLTGQGGDPVVQLQTNFGGGKTHSMLALYHLFGGTPGSELPGIDTVLAEAAVTCLPKANRVVLVGNKISPGNPVTKKDGTVVRTLWGELAYQLGGKEAFARIAKDDELATSPGDALRELFNTYGPCLILIDEWVAYARQLHDQNDLPAGGFETQFSFAQALTESAKLAKNCLLVVSLPASDTAGSPHTRTEDIEVGGVRGREALDRLRNVVGRVESSWRPATAEEGFEIVRRRLFEPIAGDMFKSRDITAQAFVELYRAQGNEFPSECRTPDYEKRIQAAFPIHPEIFDRLYTDWSTLVKFQRTRGVLRLMAAVIHSLWEKNDRSPLILPSTIPIDDPRVQSELTRYLQDGWVPIIEKDVDGPTSLPLQIDGQNASFGKIHAARRVARTIFLGSAPTSSGSAHRGLEDNRVKLGCVIPGESPNTFGDALRRLAATATYLYQDSTRFWYGTQPTVTKLADDRAEQLKRAPDKVAAELEARIKNDLKVMGDFSRIHPLPRSGADVPDDVEARLVVLPSDFPYSKEQGNPAETAAKAILENRGTTPRIYRNTLVFLAADKIRLEDLDEAIRRYLAWASILEERQSLNLDPQQTAQAEKQKKTAEGTVIARLPETYQWLLVPEQKDAMSPMNWQPIRITGTDPFAIRASKKLKSDELLIGRLAATILRRHMDTVPLWAGENVAIKQILDYFARYLYLPRVLGPEVLTQSMSEGLNLLTWEKDTFAYADSFDGSTGRYLGLRSGTSVTITTESTGLLVKPDIASQQMRLETKPVTEPDDDEPVTRPNITNGGGEEPAPIAQIKYNRFYGIAKLDASRVARDAGKIAEEVIAHLAGQIGADVTVTIEIEATLPNGASDQLVRTVTENSRTLKFSSQSFEVD